MRNLRSGNLGLFSILAVFLGLLPLVFAQASCGLGPQSKGTKKDLTERRMVGTWTWVRIRKIFGPGSRTATVTETKQIMFSEFGRYYNIASSSTDVGAMSSEAEDHGTYQVTNTGNIELVYAGSNERSNRLDVAKRAIVIDWLSEKSFMVIQHHRDYEWTEGPYIKQSSGLSTDPQCGTPPKDLSMVR